MYIYIHTQIHHYSESVWGRADIHPRIGRSLQTLLPRAWNGACFPITMATLSGKQHFLQGIALNLCEMLPGCRWPRTRSSVHYVLAAPLSPPQLSCFQPLLWPLRARGLWHLHMSKAEMSQACLVGLVESMAAASAGCWDGGAGGRDLKQLSSTSHLHPDPPQGLYDLGDSTRKNSTPI